VGGAATSPSGVLVPSGGEINEPRMEGPRGQQTLVDLTVTGGARLDDKPEEMSIKGRPLENAVSQMVNLSQQDKMDLGEAELAPIGVATGEDQKVGKDMLVDLAIHGIAREIAGLEQNTLKDTWQTREMKECCRI
jgi:hypothetical protein